MSTKIHAHQKSNSIAGEIISWFFAVLFLAIGIINSFWGNDPGFGVFIIMISFVFMPPVSSMVKNLVGLSISPIIKILLALFIIWAAIGVGELFDKIDIMRADLGW